MAAVLGGSKLGESNATLGGPPDGVGLARLAERVVTGSATHASAHQALITKLQENFQTQCIDMAQANLGLTAAIDGAVRSRSVDAVAKVSEVLDQASKGLKTLGETIVRLDNAAGHCNDRATAIRMYENALQHHTQEISESITPLLHPRSLLQQSQVQTATFADEYRASFNSPGRGTVRHIDLIREAVVGAIDESTGLLDPQAIRTIKDQVQLQKQFRPVGGGPELFTTEHKAHLSERLEQLATSAEQLAEQVTLARKLFSSQGIELPERTIAVPTPEERVGAAPLTATPATEDPMLQGLQDLDEMRERRIPRPVPVKYGPPINLGQLGAAFVSIRAMNYGEMRVGTQVEFYFPTLEKSVFARTFSPQYSDIEPELSGRESAIRAGLESLRPHITGGHTELLERALYSLERDTGLHLSLYDVKFEGGPSGYRGELVGEDRWSSDQCRVVANGLLGKFKVRFTPAGTPFIGSSGALKSLTITTEDSSNFEAEYRFGTGDSSSKEATLTVKNRLPLSTDLRIQPLSDNLTRTEAGTSFDKTLCRIVGKEQVTYMSDLQLHGSGITCTFGDRANIYNSTLSADSIALRGTNVVVSNCTFRSESGTTSLALSECRVVGSTITAAQMLAGEIKNSRVVASTVRGDTKTNISTSGTVLERCERPGILGKIGLNWYGAIVPSKE